MVLAYSLNAYSGAKHDDMITVMTCHHSNRNFWFMLEWTPEEPDISVRLGLLLKSFLCSLNGCRQAHIRASKSREDSAGVSSSLRAAWGTPRSS